MKTAHSQSPYTNKPIGEWLKITETLLHKHPLSSDEIVEVTLQCWDDILSSKIGSKPFIIGQDILLSPQVMGLLLHELIPLEFENRYPQQWRKDKAVNEKDLICLSDNKFSIEIKTSSDTTRIFGNRSYAQPTKTSKKSKSGYYLTINFDKFKSDSSILPNISLIRFGWLDHTDWRAQESATGQQANLSPEVYRYKLPIIYSTKIPKNSPKNYGANLKDGTPFSTEGVSSTSLLQAV